VLSPLKAFAALLTFAVLAGSGLVAAFAPDSPTSRESANESTRPGPREVETRLSEEEARALFDRLRRRLEAAYHGRSHRALIEVVARGSPQHAQSRRDLQLLERNNLLDRTRSRTLDVSIVAIEPDRLVVSERTAVRARYLDDATYIEVDLPLGPTRSTSEWTLEKRVDRWLIVSSRVTG